jgi:galactokinase
MTNNPRRPSAWLDALAASDAPVRLGLDVLYGDRDLVEERRQRIGAAIAHYQKYFGDEPIRLFRAPGRINLRGMHVDTHGGWLNLMAHQREVLIVAGPSHDGHSHVCNTNSTFAPLVIPCDALPLFAGRDWPDFIATPEIQARVALAPGHWRNYIEGAWLRARHAFPAHHLGGLQLVVDSNLPQGAALSSSAALCVALLHAWLGWHDLELDNDALILAAQDAEWYTGSRCGTCDQAAIVLARPNAIIHTALDPKAFTTANARALSLPEALRVLVINSFTARSISGAEKITYTTNRFAYSMAMEIFQQALSEAGYPQTTVARCGRLANITPEALGGNAALYNVLKQVPEHLDLNELRRRYVLPDLDREYARYFGDLAAEQQPTAIGLRGPLLFGIAESERARHFALAIETGDFARAGQLMTIGHDGDRRVDRHGNPIHQRADRAWLDECAARDFPIENCPGVYGASSPALDYLVDAALSGGALGASLTGAGIAGTVLALCRTEDAAPVASHVRSVMAGETYQQRARLHRPLDADRLDEAVVENRACFGAGEIGLSLSPG